MRVLSALNKTAALLGLLCLLSWSTQAQSDSILVKRAPEKEPFTLKGKLFTGGGFSLQFGDVTFVEVSPLLGYHVYKHAQVGVGATYRYLRYRVGNFSTDVYGGRVFARHAILPNTIFAHVEYERLSAEYQRRSDLQILRKWTDAYFVGGAYSQGNEKVSVNFTILYNLKELEEAAPYNSPLVIRVLFFINI